MSSKYEGRKKTGEVTHGSQRSFLVPKYEEVGSEEEV